MFPKVEYKMNSELLHEGVNLMQELEESFQSVIFILIFACHGHSQILKWEPYLHVCLFTFILHLLYNLLPAHVESISCYRALLNSVSLSYGRDLVVLGVSGKDIIAFIYFTRTNI